MAVTVGILKKANPGMLRDIQGLLVQLRKSGGGDTATMSELRNVLNDKNTFMIIAKDGARIVGMAMLYVTLRIGRRTGQVEDVVVDDSYRGRGLGKGLMQKLIEQARKKKLKAIYLTSRPARVAANALYQKVGFEKKETNAYCLKLRA